MINTLKNLYFDILAEQNRRNQRKQKTLPCKSREKVAPSKKTVKLEVSKDTFALSSSDWCNRVFDIFTGNDFLIIFVPDYRTNREPAENIKTILMFRKSNAEIYKTVELKFKGIEKLKMRFCTSFRSWLRDIYVKKVWGVENASI